MSMPPSFLLHPFSNVLILGLSYVVPRVPLCCLFAREARITLSHLGCDIYRCTERQDVERRSYTLRR
ncbi:hypothetical protein F5B18DRAFT_623444 [Nemania serpens]|nr:hypothetical protein F5B18DRAFT_623444 [Nemania serpens]